MAKRSKASNQAGKSQTWSKVPHDLPGSVSCMAVSLFVALMKFAKNKSPHTCYPSQESLCNLVLRQSREGLVPVSIKSIQRAQQELVDAHRLVVKRRKNKSSLYTLYPDILAPDPRPEANTGSDPCVATGSDSDDRLEATPESDELEPPELGLNTGLGRERHAGVDASRQAKISADLTRQIQAACPECKRDSATFEKCRETVESFQRICDKASVVEALQRMARHPVSKTEFRAALWELTDAIAPAPF